MAERHRKELLGTVLSHQMEKAAIVNVVRLIKHPAYGKVIRRQKKYVAHDERNVAKVGDKVRLRETRPMSKTKRWKVIEVLGSSK